MNSTKNPPIFRSTMLCICMVAAVTSTTIFATDTDTEPCRATPANNQSQRPQIELRNIEIPVSLEHPDGMKVLQSEADDYQAEYIPNVPYAVYGERTLTLQVVLPRDKNFMLPPELRQEISPRPLIVFVQGSGWGPQNVYSAIPQISELAHHGYVVASVEYRT
jgi:hypothetical protein